MATHADWLALVQRDGLVISEPVLEEQFPGSLDDVLERFMSDCENSLAGIEVYYSRHTPEQEKRYLTLCQELGLIATGGSDFHRPTTGGTEMGSGAGRLRVPPDTFERISEAIAARRS